VCVCVCVCVCACVCTYIIRIHTHTHTHRERERERERDAHTHTLRHLEHMNKRALGRLFVSGHALKMDQVRVFKSFTHRPLRHPSVGANGHKGLAALASLVHLVQLKKKSQCPSTLTSVLATKPLWRCFYKKNSSKTFEDLYPHHLPHSV